MAILKKDGPTVVVEKDSTDKPVDDTTVQSTAQPEAFEPTGHGGQYIAVGGGKVVRAPAPK